jgi:hypothetical protein
MPLSLRREESNQVLNMKLFYYIRRFWEIPGVERILLFKAVLSTCAFSVIVQTLPMKYYMVLLKPSKAKCKRIINEFQCFKLIGTAINRTGKIIPWNSSCLVKSLVYKYLLEYFGISGSIAISAIKSPMKSMSLHAYVIYDGHPVFLYKRSKSSVNLPFNCLENGRR